MLKKEVNNQKVKDPLLNIQVSKTNYTLENNSQSIEERFMNNSPS
jgi:hypothetical protein